MTATILAAHFSLGIESVVAFYRVLVVIGPILVFILTRRVCIALQKKDRGVLLHGYETGRIVRLPGGEYVEVRHDPITGDELKTTPDRVVESAHVEDRCGR